MRKHGKKGQQSAAFPRWASLELLLRPRVSLQCRSDRRAFLWQTDRSRPASLPR
ncbi:MAG: hypothetical protein WCU88_01110 [Elusimicrobiota bacterium]